ncbi:hypothetical protein JR316_0010683 [Psilocybe cubensis]|uniref:Uncharacterized protein n=2 Tax=Psilocybe cubensis TaxID=181762 RepID=A0A8H7XY25_PSICU|nr:hypothetical protein JR316_0010683 [Psilocybe cubensis]KAH9476768.1 hypothetical protein JR316_0010683 [Psilocybe cubensis]
MNTPYTLRFISSRNSTYNGEHDLVLPAHKLEQLHDAVDELNTAQLEHKVEMYFALPMDADAVCGMLVELASLRKIAAYDKSFGFMLSEKNIACLVLERWDDVPCERSAAYYDLFRPQFRTFLQKLDVIYESVLGDTQDIKQTVNSNDSMDDLSQFFKGLSHHEI